MAEEYTIPEELRLPLEIEVMSACEQIDYAIKEIAGDNEELVVILQGIRASICAVTPQEEVIE